MAKILNIETSSKSCSICLSEEGKVLARRYGEEAFEHSRDLTVFIEELIKESDFSLRDLDAIAVNRGPGSYTALRVGLSVAKGLCFGLDLKLISHTAFEILYQAARERWKESQEKGIIVPMIDARRAEVYMSAFNSSGEKIIDEQSFVLDQEQLVKKINTTSKVLVAGDAAEKSKEYLSTDIFEFLPMELDASLMVPLSEVKFRSSSFDDLAYSVPEYIKPPNIVASKKKYF